MAILSKWCKQNNFESHNSLKLSFTNIWGLCLNFVQCESFLEWNSPDMLLYVRQAWMIQLILVISLWGVLSSFNPKGFYHSHGWSHSSCEGRTFSYTGLIPWKLCRFLLMFWTGFTPLLALIFSLSITFFV